MKPGTLIKKGANRLVFKRSYFRYFLINAIKKQKSRDKLNRMYNRLGHEGKATFHYYFSKLFRNNHIALEDALWKVDFNGKTISLPLTEKNLWLDWDQAVSILGHDITIKKTYEDLIKRKKVNCFFDIGANYGTHSLLFLSQGIRTITFEPNPNCTKVFRKFLEINNLQGEIVPNAVGDRDYETELYFPEKETWLGTLSEGIKTDLENKFDLTKVKTQVVSLDSFLIGKDLVPSLMKIDTEGYEVQVLNGAANTIRKHKPMIIFEENEGATKRVNIADFFESVGYSVFRLPYLEGKKDQFEREEFLSSKERDFIAVFNQGKS